MSGRAVVALLADGRRLHLQHGPIDLIAEACGPADELAAAYRQAASAFDGLLDRLVAELAALRRPVRAKEPRLAGPVARRMAEAAWPHRSAYVTPMAAVAGAVADHVLAAMVAGRRLARAYVNDGGDIALFISPGQSFRTGVVQRLEAPVIAGIAEITHVMPVRGIATSGWRGRSHSLGIADAVTVFAGTAAAADVAATLVANAVTVDHPSIERRPAASLDPDTDLGDRLVTVAVGPLDRRSVAVALDAGAGAAEEMCKCGLVWGAVLSLRGEMRLVGADRLLAAA